MSRRKMPHAGPDFCGSIGFLLGLHFSRQNRCIRLGLASQEGLLPERWDYPLEALREIVVNMIVHRDYMSSNDSIIKIFDDGIEFFNPGKLPDGLAVKHVKQLISGKYASCIRNKQIASVFKEVGIIEKYGPGIKRVLEAFQGYGLAQPIFEEIQNGFKIAVSKTTQKTTTRDKILEILHTSPNMTREELADVLGKSPNTIKEHIARLKPMVNWSESEAIGMGIGEYSMKKVTKHYYYLSQ